MLFKDGVGSVCVKGGEEKGEEVNQENIQEEDGDLNIKKKKEKKEKMKEFKQSSSCERLFPDGYTFLISPVSFRNQPIHPQPKSLWRQSKRLLDSF